jgi:hypothetical protein
MEKTTVSFINTTDAQFIAFNSNDRQTEILAIVFVEDLAVDTIEFFVTHIQKLIQKGVNSIGLNTFMLSTQDGDMFFLMEDSTRNDDVVMIDRNSLLSLLVQWKNLVEKKAEEITIMQSEEGYTIDGRCDAFKEKIISNLKRQFEHEMRKISIANNMNIGLDLKFTLIEANEERHTIDHFMPAHDAGWVPYLVPGILEIEVLNQKISMDISVPNKNYGIEVSVDGSIKTSVRELVD